MYVCLQKNGSPLADGGKVMKAKRRRKNTARYYIIDKSLDLIIIGIMIDMDSEVIFIDWYEAFHAE